MELSKKQLAYLKSLDSKKKKRKFLLDCLIESIEVEIEETPKVKPIVFKDGVFQTNDKEAVDFLEKCGFIKNTKEESQELIAKPNEVAELHTDFCVKITDENRGVLQEIWSKRGKAVVGNYLITNSLNTFLMQNNEPFLEVENFGKIELPIVTKDEFLKYIGREDLIEKESESDYQKRIIQEAIKKGFCKGVEFKSVEPNCFNESIITFGNINDTFEFDGLDMYNSKGWILKNGIWAEIIKSPKYSPEEIELVKHNINQREVSEQGSELLKFPNFENNENLKWDMNKTKQSQELLKFDMLEEKTKTSKLNDAFFEQLNVKKELLISEIKKIVSTFENKEEGISVLYNFDKIGFFIDEDAFNKYHKSAK